MNESLLILLKQEQTILADLEDAEREHRYRVAIKDDYGENWYGISIQRNKEQLAEKRIEIAHQLEFYRSLI